MTALGGVEPSRFTLAKVDPNERDFVALAKRSTNSAAAGRPTEEARTGWWHKISGPLSTVLMPLLAATAAFGLARSGQGAAPRDCIGMALGFAYFVADNFSVALGNYGAYPPFLAAWAPFLLFLLIGEFVLIRQAGRVAACPGDMRALLALAAAPAADREPRDQRRQPAMIGIEIEASPGSSSAFRRRCASPSAW